MDPENDLVQDNFSFLQPSEKYPKAVPEMARTRPPLGFFRCRPGRPACPAWVPKVKDSSEGLTDVDPNTWL